MNRSKNKITTLWILYIVSIIPAIINIISNLINYRQFADYTNTTIGRYTADGLSLPSGLFAHQFLSDNVREFLHSIGKSVNFYTDTQSFFIRNLICGLIITACILAIVVIGRKTVFNVGNSVFLLSPFILYIIAWLPAVITDAQIGDWANTIYNFAILVYSILLIITQIYLIIKLAKATKQLKA